MSTSAAHHPPVRTPSRLFAYASFAIMVGGWVAFAVALVACQQTLYDVWTSDRDLPLVAERRRRACSARRRGAARCRDARCRTAGR